MMICNEENEIYDIFISYRRSDGVYAAKLLRNYLSEMGYKVFLDLNIERVGEFPIFLKNILNNSKNFILLITKDLFSERINNKDDWIVQEISIALKKKIKILPLMVSSELGIPKDLPESIKKLKNWQAHLLNLAIRDDECKKVLETYVSQFDTDKKTIVDSPENSLDSDKEFERLMVQIENSEELDKERIDKVLKSISEEKRGEKICILDVGCRSGDPEHNPFNNGLCGKVLEIDRSEKWIENRRSKFCDFSEKFVFEIIDLKDDEFEDKLDAIMKNNRIEKFDLVFAPMILHYLPHTENSPPVALRVLQKFYGVLNDGGYIIVKASDDGSKIAFEDKDETLAKIIRLTEYSEGIADREFGRKIYKYLCDAGFRRVRMFSNMRDTSALGQELKLKLFKETFDWRVDACDNDADKKQMIELCKSFKPVFQKNNFWYCDHDYVGIGKKICD